MFIIVVNKRLINFIMDATMYGMFYCNFIVEYVLCTVTYSSHRCLIRLTVLANTDFLFNFVILCLHPFCLLILSVN